jgi:ArsR family transcriptional regulator, arsenate/arsenite/antimonite-responsive transcriptional repressor
MPWQDGDMPKLLPVIDSPTTAVCCAPLSSAPLSTDEARTLAGQLKALADPARLRLLSLMMANPDLEACTCDLTEALGLSQPTVSHHLKKLTEAGLVFAHRREGSWTYYRVVPDALAGLANVIAPAGATDDRSEEAVASSSR